MTTSNFIRGYLRASTQDQDATRARDSLQEFVGGYGLRVASWYVENESGTKAERSELIRLLKDSQPGDVLLVENVDRLTRLTNSDWEVMKVTIRQAGIRIVSMDLPTSHVALSFKSDDDFTSRMLDAVNGMLLDMLAAIARKDYEDRRLRQAQGIAAAKARGGYKGRPIDVDLREKVVELLQNGFSIRKTAKLVGCAPSTVQRTRKEL